MSGSRTISNISRDKTDAVLVGLRTAASVAVLSGAAGSVGFLLRATSRNPSQLLVVLMAVWVASPFVALLVASFLSKAWSTPVQAALYGVMLLAALGSLAMYAADALWPRSSQAAFVFIAVPPATWLLCAVPIFVTALVSARRSAPR